MLVVVALGCLVFQLRLPGKAIPETDYHAAVAVLNTEAQPGDVVLLYPWWTERARLFVPERIPVVGYLGVDADSLELYPRIWLLGAPALPRADLDGFVNHSAFTPDRTAVGPARAFGGLTLQLFENHRHRKLVTDYASLLAGAHVYLEAPDGSRSECRWDGAAQRCPNGAEVVQEWREILFAPRKCLRLYPPGGAAKLVAEFPPAPAAAQLSLRAGMTWDRGFFHSPEITPTDVGVDINGQPATSLTIGVGQQGWAASDGPAIPEGASVRVWSRANNAMLRELCVAVYGRERGP